MQCLIINHSVPFNNYNAQEMLELALALATFEENIKLLFIGEAVLQLLKAQQPELLFRKDFIVTFKALPLYDIREIYLDAASLQQYQLEPQDLIINAKIINKAKIVKLIETANLVINI